MSRYGVGVYGVGVYGGGSGGPVPVPPMQPLRVVPMGPPMAPILPIVVVAPSGQWVILDAVGRVSGLSFSWSYPGGPMSADWSLDAPPSAQIPALVQGAAVTIYRGTSKVWTGRVATLERGAPWRITADGTGSLAVHEPAPTSGRLDGIVDAAITAGLPWTRPASLSTRTWTMDGTDPAKLDQVLTDVLLRQGQRWAVTADGVVSAVTDPTTPSLLVAADTAPPLVLGQYASEVTVTYQTGTGSYPTVRVTSPTAGRFGRVPATLDLHTSVMTSTEATAAGQAYLARRAPAMTLAGDLTVTAGQITTASGGHVDLPLVRPGQVMRLGVLTLTRDALAVPVTAVDVLIGQTTYHADDATLAVSPINRAPSPGEVILGAAA